MAYLKVWLMMNKVLYYNSLFTIYKELLTQKEQNIFSLYYEENLSLSEIAENLKITRSAVGNTVKTVEKKLDFYEEKLKVFEKNSLLNLALFDNISNDLKNKILKNLD